mgnify:CR=1 FL=1
MQILTNSAVLHGLRGHIVEVVSTEELVSDWHDPEMFPIIVIDIDEAEGIYTSRIIKKTGTTAHIIGLTEDLYFDPEHWTENKAIFIEQGGDYLLRAPINPRELLACIAALKRRATVVRPTIYLYNRRLLINVADCTVVFDNAMLYFTERELALFLDLAAHLGQLRSKEQILQSMYAQYTDCEIPELKILDVFVCKMRQKLEKCEEGLGGVIQTIWGQGYRLVEIEEQVEHVERVAV